MTASDIVVIFDLGNVVLPFNPLKPCAVLGERAGMSDSDACQTIYRNNLERRFEQGLLDGDRFTAGVAEALGIGLDPNEFHDLWVDMFVEDEAVSAIVRELKPHHKLILLSNTNPWHWEHAHAKFPVLSEFDAAVASFEVGVLKPHPLVYRAALEKAGSPERAIFIDDIATNAAGAQVLGITGVHFKSAEQLRGELLKLECELG